jgi:hypothetical protein
MRVLSGMTREAIDALPVGALLRQHLGLLVVIANTPEDLRVIQVEGYMNVRRPPSPGRTQERWMPKPMRGERLGVTRIA